ncbi:MAG: phycobilisome rod-core linker polypeptide [Chloroflexota bacterium]|nr:phycobilisome rod-core linker polypeptide [Chloroflexota bacterium]
MFGFGQQQAAGYWGAQGAQEALEAAFQQILGRPIDVPGLESWGRYLVLQGGTMREVIRGLGHSDEYRQRFVDPLVPTNNWGAIIRPMYLKFLGRPPENEAAVVAHSHALVRNGQYQPEGYKQLVNAFVDSDEYLQRWGEQGIPGFGQHPNPQR